MRRTLVMAVLLACAVAIGLAAVHRRSTLRTEGVGLQLDEREADGPCQAGRWPVKTLTDPGARLLVLAPVSTTVADLGALPRPSPAVGEDTPRQAAERQVVRVDAQAYADHLEADLDIHLVIHDPSKPRASMIVELPDPRCTGGADPALRARMTDARNAYVSACGPASGDQGDYYVDGPLTVTGVRFFDTFVGQFGLAPNAVEIHPVLSLVARGPCRKHAGPTTFDVTSSIDEGSTLSGPVTWTANTVAGSAKVSAIEFLVDGKRVGGNAGRSQASTTIDTTKLVNGRHSFTVHATLADDSTTFLVNHAQTRGGIAPPPAPTVRIAPARVRAGRTLVVSASHFLGGALTGLTLERGGAQLATTTRKAPATGGMRMALRVPPTARAGAYTIHVCQNGCALHAAGRVTVLR